jgi:alpha 1,2-mannosyltransferase
MKIGARLIPYIFAICGFVLVLVSFKTFQSVYNVEHSNGITSTQNNNKNEPMRACFVVLVRNSELNGIVSSIRQLESTFNNKFNYPYVFLNDDDFTPEFIETTSALTNAKTKYGKVDGHMWGYPSFINTTHAAECRAELAKQGIPYADSESYRHMCR